MTRLASNILDLRRGSPSLYCSLMHPSYARGTNASSPDLFTSPIDQCFHIGVASCSANQGSKPSLRKANLSISALWPSSSSSQEPQGHGHAYLQLQFVHRADSTQIDSDIRFLASAAVSHSFHFNPCSCTGVISLSRPETKNLDKNAR